MFKYVFLNKKTGEKVYTNDNILMRDGRYELLFMTRNTKIKGKRVTKK